jgi:hypothetical protein
VLVLPVDPPAVPRECQHAISFGVLLHNVLSLSHL